MSLSHVIKVTFDFKEMETTTKERAFDKLRGFVEWNSRKLCETEDRTLLC
jgi:hypothetical protein